MLIAQEVLTLLNIAVIIPVDRVALSAMVLTLQTAKQIAAHPFSNVAPIAQVVTTPLDIAVTLIVDRVALSAMLITLHTAKQIAVHPFSNAAPFAREATMPLALAATIVVDRVALSVAAAIPQRVSKINLKDEEIISELRRVIDIVS